MYISKKHLIYICTFTGIFFHPITANTIKTYKHDTISTKNILQKIQDSVTTTIQSIVQRIKSNFHIHSKPFVQNIQVDSKPIVQDIQPIYEQTIKKQDEDEYIYDTMYKHNFKIRPYLFVPHTKLYRNIYGKIGGGVQVEFEKTMSDHGSFWINLDGLFKRGHSIGLCQKTRISTISLSSGIKYCYEYNKRLQLALGIGPSIAGIFIKDQSVCCPNKNSKCSGGFVIKTDLHGFIHDRVFLDLFLDYTYQHVHFNKNINVGGTKIGLGIGWTF